MRQVLVEVDWVHPANGGRSVLPEGNEYTAVGKFPQQRDQEWLQSAWSIKINWVHPGSESGWYGIAQFLVEQAPHEWLVPNSHFELYEGPQLVAKVKVLISEKTIAGIKALATV